MGKEKDEYQPPSGPPPGKLNSNNPWYKRLGHSSSRQPEENSQAYTPPASYTPPQAHSSSSSYEPPSGPPPSHKGTSAPSYAPPSGPPPSTSYAPPPGPPPNMSSEEPPPYHDWTVIPDNSLLPPPPSIGYDASPTANASSDEGEAAYLWCQRNPLYPPGTFTPDHHNFIQSGQLTLLRPPTFQGDLHSQQRPGAWNFRTKAKCTDSCLLTSLPLYAAQWDSPLHTRRAKTIYFELQFNTKNGPWREEPEFGVAIGFVAPPFPTFRLPGWQRGSLGVHGDDGHRYVNDTFGGSDFTTPFMPGQRLGIGITFAPPHSPPGYGDQGGSGKLDIRVFFTRDGVEAGSWDGTEELDQRSEGGTVGLVGDCDLFAAIGVFGGVDCDVYFAERDWKYRIG
ncbi:hypothetical protein BU16DRAFT_344458 [Lophium mytilinum]|uniref:SPRY domain-containing protein n=1 Tax=Lophium mytilinum TaxID=390894 RepID=A0A6A6QYU3_9PEZI|nr:hypothetical protein BU16DRAFT_344458 [Lophium mytilinum]